MKYCVLLFLALYSGFFSSAQTDTIRVCQYNLLNYGNSANPVSFKNPRLRTILGYVQPDIFGANEIRNDSNMRRIITDSVLGAGWACGAYINTNNETQTNMLFWRKDRFSLLSQQSICHNLRDIIAYRLYYRDTAATPSPDTVFFTVIVAHLKASSGSQNAAARALETQDVAAYLDVSGPGNYIFMGDLNLYTSAEAAYQNLIDNPHAASRLFDPIGRPGRWSGDTTFTDIHTQATRTATNGDGGVTGGLDDRFDHIMVSGSVMNDLSGMRYLSGSYRSPGQDGRHFKKALTDTPANTSAPSGVIQALYEMSDHLPVQASFVMNRRYRHVGVPAVAGTPGLTRLMALNPFTEEISLVCPPALDEPVQAALYALTGQELARTALMPSGGRMTWHTGLALPPGLYLLRVTDRQGNGQVLKLVKH